jgi:hypothetical protein
LKNGKGFWKPSTEPLLSWLGECLFFSKADIRLHQVGVCYWAVHTSKPTFSGGDFNSLGVRFVAKERTLNDAKRHGGGAFR